MLFPIRITSELHMQKPMGAMELSGWAALLFLFIATLVAGMSAPAFVDAISPTPSSPPQEAKAPKVTQPLEVKELGTSDTAPALKNTAIITASLYGVPDHPEIRPLLVISVTGIRVSESSGESFSRFTKTPIRLADLKKPVYRHAIRSPQGEKLGYALVSLRAGSGTWDKLAPEPQLSVEFEELK